MKEFIGDIQKYRFIDPVKDQEVYSIGMELLRRLNVANIYYYSHPKQNLYDFSFKIGINQIPFYGHFHTWDEHKDEIIELLKEQINEN